MYLIGDIGNTAVKICLFNNNLKLIKNIKIYRKNLNKKFIKKELLFLRCRGFGLRCLVQDWCLVPVSKGCGSEQRRLDQVTVISIDVGKV